MLLLGSYEENEDLLPVVNAPMETGGLLVRSQRAWRGRGGRGVHHLLSYEEPDTPGGRLLTDGQEFTYGSPDDTLTRGTLGVGTRDTGHQRWTIEIPQVCQPVRPVQPRRGFVYIGLTDHSRATRLGFQTRLAESVPELVVRKRFTTITARPEANLEKRRAGPGNKESLTRDLSPASLGRRIAVGETRTSLSRELRPSVAATAMAFDVVDATTDVATSRWIDFTEKTVVVHGKLRNYLLDINRNLRLI